MSLHSFLTGLFAVVLLASCTASKEIKQITSFNEALNLVAKDYQGFPIIQGATSSDQTEIAILHKVEDRLETTVGSDVNGLINWMGPSERSNESFEGSNWQVSQFLFKGLKPQQRYVLRVMSVSGDIMDMREFGSLDTTNLKVKFAVASCMDDAHVDDEGEMWVELVAHAPDVVFFIGDNVYGDRRGKQAIAADPRTLWERYVETRNKIPLFRFQKLVPVFATWDDHDFGINNGDRNFGYKDEAKKTFLSFFPQKELVGFYERGEGVSSSFSAWGQQFILLDDRSFRAPSKDTKNQTHWGKGQEDWLFRKIKKADQPTWLINGDQFFGKYHQFESYEGDHPASFKKFLAQLKALKARVIFISGDRHLTELMEIKGTEFGFPTYELTTSAIHAGTYADGWAKFPNPRKIEGASGVINYAVVESEVVNRTGLKLRISAFGPEKRVLYDRRVSVGLK